MKTLYNLLRYTACKWLYGRLIGFPKGFGLGNEKMNIAKKRGSNPLNRKVNSARNRYFCKWFTQSKRAISPYLWCNLFSSDFGGNRFFCFWRFFLVLGISFFMAVLFLIFFSLLVFLASNEIKICKKMPRINISNASNSEVELLWKIQSINDLNMSPFFGVFALWHWTDH